MRATIIHVITELGSGGSERVLVRLITGSSKFRHVVVPLTGDGDLAAVLRSAGIDVIPLHMRRDISSVLTAIVRLSRIIGRERPALIETWLYHADLIGLLAAKLARFRPVVWNLRCSNLDLSRYRWSTRAVLRLLTWLSVAPAAIIVNSEAGRRWHSALGYRPRQWKLVPNGVDLTVFHPDAEAQARWRQRLGIKREAILVGMVARRDPMKDHEGILQAAAEAARLRHGLAFVFAGHGVSRDDPTLARLANEVSAPVHLIGECKDIPGLMASLDVSVLASISEGFPNVVAEAMATAVPCVVTDVGDATTVVGASGRIVPPRDSSALAEAIVALAADEQLRLRLGLAGRRRIAEHFDLGSAVAQYETTWQRLMTPEARSTQDPGADRGPAATAADTGSPPAIADSPATDVSVVIPVYNREHVIGRSIQRALGQTHLPREIIVVDDASTDETCAAVCALDDSRVKLIRHERNLGAAAARNTGIAAATGTWIALLDSDDEWMPEKLARQLRRIADGPPGTRACVTGYTICDRRYERVDHFHPGPKECSLRSLAWGCSLSPGSTLLARRQAFFDVGPFDTRLVRFEDWDWLVRFCRDNVLVSEPQALTIIHKAINPSQQEIESSIGLLREKHRETFYKVSRMSGRRFDSSVLVERAAGAYYQCHYTLTALMLLRATATYPFRNGAFFRMLGRRMWFLLRRRGSEPGASDRSRIPNVEGSDLRPRTLGSAAGKRGWN